MSNASASRALHDAHPRLAAKLPHVRLAELPTPVTRYGDAPSRIFVKRDDLTSPLYGGNKVRKLEYLLAQAVRHGCRRVATLGSAGSNHATATALHAHAVGLDCINFLSRQRATPWVARNLLAQLGANAHIVYVGGDRESIGRAVHATLQAESGKTWLIPLGGSSCTGTLGYVNAAFELAAQIAAGELPPPDAIYLPLGTMGTAVGLCIGLRASGLSAPLVAVRVVDESVGSAARARRLFERTSALLNRLDPDFPRTAFRDAGFCVRDEQFGRGYAHATEAAKEALDHAASEGHLKLETTYSAKALAALLLDMRNGDLDGKNVLFWNTFSSAPPPVPATTPDPGGLPPELRDYVAAEDRG